MLNSMIGINDFKPSNTSVVLFLNDQEQEYILPIQRFIWKFDE